MTTTRTHIQGALGDLIDELVEQHATAAVEDLWDRMRAAAPTVEGALRLSKAAQAIDVSTTTIRRMVEAGDLEAIDIAGVAHIRTSEINRWLVNATAQARRAKVAADARAARRRRGRATA